MRTKMYLGPIADNRRLIEENINVAFINCLAIIRLFALYLRIRWICNNIWRYGRM